MSSRRRFKKALVRQQQVQMDDSVNGGLEAGAERQYVEQEPQVNLSNVEAEKSLEELVEYRPSTTAQIENLPKGPDDEVNQQKMAELEDNLASRKAQILSDLKQKMLTADQENESRTQWANMPEAEVEIKCLSELLVDTMQELQNQKEAYERLMGEFEICRAELGRQIAFYERQLEQKPKRTRGPFFFPGGKKVV